MRPLQERLKTDEDATTGNWGNTTVSNGVKGDVGKVSADVTDTKNDLAAPKEVDHAIGDL